MRFDGVHSLLAVGEAALLDAEHRGDVRAGDVRVDNADRRAKLRERDGEVRRDRGLADAALVGGDGDQVLDAGDRLGAALAARLPAHLRVPLDLDLVDAGNGVEGGPHVDIDLLAQRAGRGGQHQAEGRSSALDGQVAHHVERHEVAMQLGIADLGESGQHGLGTCHVMSSHYASARGRAQIRANSWKLLQPGGNQEAAASVPYTGTECAPARMQAPTGKAAGCRGHGRGLFPGSRHASLRGWTPRHWGLGSSIAARSPWGSGTARDPGRVAGDAGGVRGEGGIYRRFPAF